MSVMEYCVLRSTVGVVGWIALTYFGYPWFGFGCFLLMVSWVSTSDKCKCDSAGDGRTDK